MGALDPRVAAILDELVPRRQQPDRWQTIVASATAAGLGKRRWFLRAGPVVAVAAAIAVFVLAWPFGGGGPSGTILQRAAAALGDGPVVHAVIQDGWGGTLVDLQSGAQSQIHGKEEIWYDPSRGIHDVSLFDGVVQWDAIYPPGRVSYLDKTFADIATGYRQALKNRSARVLGPDIVNGTPVYWIRVDTQMLPDVADGKLHEWAHDVAVSQSTYQPVATRDTRDGKTGPDGNSTILQIETLPAGQGNFTLETPDTNGVAMKSERGASLTPAETTAALGQPGLWAGTSVAGLDLGSIRKNEQSVGYDPQTKTWAKTYTTVTLFYGQLDGSNRLPWVGAPNLTTPFVQISESPTLFLGFQRGASNYSPPEGSVLIVGGRIGIMKQDGLHLALEASSEDLLLALARDLQQMPS
jgi:hypothetical protein